MGIGVTAVSEIDGGQSLGLFKTLPEALRFVLENFQNFILGDIATYPEFKQIEFNPVNGEYYIDEVSENTYMRVGLVTGVILRVDANES